MSWLTDSYEAYEKYERRGPALDSKYAHDKYAQEKYEEQYAEKFAPKYEDKVSRTS